MRRATPRPASRYGRRCATLRERRWREASSAWRRCTARPTDGAPTCSTTRRRGWRRATTPCASGLARPARTSSRTRCCGCARGPESRRRPAQRTRPGASSRFLAPRGRLGQNLRELFEDGTALRASSPKLFFDLGSGPRIVQPHVELVLEVVGPRGFPGGGDPIGMLQEQMSRIHQILRSPRAELQSQEPVEIDDSQDRTPEREAQRVIPLKGHDLRQDIEPYTFQRPLQTGEISLEEITSLHHSLDSARNQELLSLSQVKPGEEIDVVGRPRVTVNGNGQSPDEHAAIRAEDLRQASGDAREIWLAPLHQPVARRS